VLIRTSEPQSIFYGAARIRACGSGRAEPLYVFFYMPRGSGTADPKKNILHDDARIRGVRIRASEPLKKILLHDDARIRGVRIRASELLYENSDGARIRECGSGRRNRYMENYDDARIRECGSGRRTSF
jgi:uncharacterized protein (DUF433 family)